MSKLKYAPKPPPEPIIDETLEPGPKKRGRKRTKKQYFTPDTDAAIKEYLASSNQDERDNIFSRRIHYPFYKLAENLIHTFNSNHIICESEKNEKLTQVKKYSIKTLKSEV